MGPIPFAFSVHHFISSVGADAGFASIIGLALLVLLYFAQARETSSLREQAYEAAQRVQQLEGRMTQLARQQAPAVAPPTPAPALRAPGARPLASPITAGAPGMAVGAAGFAAGAYAAGAPAAPAGVGAPALTAATRLIPAGAGAGGAYGAPQPAMTAGGATSDRPVGATAVVAPPPATVAGGANGTVQDQLQAAPIAAEPAAAEAPPRVPLPPRAPAPAGRRSRSEPRSRSPRGSSGSRRAVAVIFLVLAVAAVVAGLLVLTSGGASPKPAASTSARSSNAPAARHHRTKPAALSPSSVTVAVLNGTATSGLAHRVAQKLGTAGYKQGNVGNIADQTRTSTVVAYLPGHKAAATAVAAALKLGPASVQPVDQNTQAVACPQPSACGATDVVVTVGSDLVNTQ